MFISLVEILYTGDIETKQKYRGRNVLAICEDAGGIGEIFRQWRLAGLREGRNIQVVRTALHPDNPHCYQNRRLRRFHNRLLQRLLKHIKRPKEEIQP